MTELERAVPGVPRRRPGLFVVDLEGAMIGTITLDRRDAESPGPVSPDAWEVALGYMFLPEAWGSVYSRQSWGSPRWSGSRKYGAESNGSACGPRSRRPVELVLDSAADPRGHRGFMGGHGARLHARVWSPSG